MSLYCDPEEVLYHLRTLGYENVSEQQLKEFIRDLKKLIKYDLRKNSTHKEKSKVDHAVDSTYDSSYSCSFSETSAVRSEDGISSGLNSKSHDSEEVYYSSDSLSSCSVNSIDLPDYPKLAKKLALKPSIGGARTQSRRLAEEKKPRSFIRSWKLNQPSGTVKCDPVSLYHWYQEYWNKQKVPGEESHKQLRWSVREKMLGEDPHPRPMSQASGHSSRNVKK